MRGEHEYERSSDNVADGSSPHARGARHAVPGDLVGRGLIPACAGSTFSRINFAGSREAHPRMRGEHCWVFWSVSSLRGSSPHARGAPSPRLWRPLVPRLIPACAGSTPHRSAAGSSCWAHPRMRGEHIRNNVLSPAIGGSSPHARGALPSCSRSTPRVRLIPACAGSTCSRCFPAEWGAAHPRMRGEHATGCPRCGLAGGSSPHAQGAPHPFRARRR